MKVNIIYWSGTGNTKAMADAISQGAKSQGAEVREILVSDASLADVKNVDRLAFGCPAMGQEELEETEMRPFMNQANEYLTGKKVLLFGSYEWASGEWMDKWIEEVNETGANLISDGLISYDYPYDDLINECTDMGIELCK
ncbi:MAG: flavodoxin [Anaerococcus sp.]|nr:flavodoxin [Peptoniphilaceae bacterium]MDY3055825.1 flavodoxin [Anaerococcus sp.]